MAVLSRDDYLDRIQNVIGNDVSDESIQFMEDMTDTFNHLESQANGDGIDWEQRYHDLDESWKQKYKHRFFSSGGISNASTQGEDSAEDEVTPETIQFDDLFE